MTNSPSSKSGTSTTFEAKESYRWVEALTTLEAHLGVATRAIDVFDREGDIAEVFECVRQLQHTGVVIRAAHNRSLDRNSERLWAKLEAQPIRFYQEIVITKNTDSSRSHG